MNNINFTDTAPTLHQRIVRNLERMAATSKAAAKKLVEVTEVGRKHGWND